MASWRTRSAAARGRPLNIGQQAMFEQWTQALDDGERSWPHNEASLGDERMERLLLDGLGGPSPTEGWDGLKPGRVWMLWPASGTAVDCEPGRPIAEIAADTFPKYATPCERCGSTEPTYGGLVMNAGAVNVGLLICAGCAMELDLQHGPLKWVAPQEGGLSDGQDGNRQ